MDKNKLYSIGQIHKLKLLKSHLNKPLRSKSHISSIVRKMDYIEFKTATGHKAKGLTYEQINNYNIDILKK